MTVIAIFILVFLCTLHTYGSGHLVREKVVFICICICICISLIWKYAFGGRRSGVDFVSLSLSSSPPLQLFRRRRPVATLCIMYLCIFCLYFSSFFCQDSHFLRYPDILSALTLFFMHQHTSPREGLPYPPYHHLS